MKTPVPFLSTFEIDLPPGGESIYPAVWMNEGTGTIQFDDVLCIAR